MSEATPQAEPKYTREKVEAELAGKAWQDPAFMEELRTNPKAVIAKEYGLQIPDSVELKVIEETPNTIYLRIPPNPGDLELSDEQLEMVAGGEFVVSATVIGITGIVTGVVTSGVSTSASVTVSKGW
jgi:hypothetical protein